jgi:signal transduction histidine kinase
VDLPESAPFAGWSEGLLRCVTNLLDNAVKYTAGRFEANPGGKVSLRMVRDDLLPAWRIAVADNGIGIPEAMRHHIFERFRRGDASRVRNGKAKGGYGLGLAIVKRMAELHGGSVLLEDSDEGAAFTIVLPDPPSGASRAKRLRNVAETTRGCYTARKEV